MALIINRVKLPTIYPRFAMCVYGGVHSSLSHETREELADYDRQIKRGGQNVEQLSSCGTRKTDSSDHEACGEGRSDTRSSEIWARLAVPRIKCEGLDQDSGVSQNRTENNEVVAFIFARDYNTHIELENANGHDAENTMSVLARLREELRV